MGAPVWEPNGPGRRQHREREVHRRVTAGRATASELICPTRVPAEHGAELLRGARCPAAAPRPRRRRPRPPTPPPRDHDGSSRRGWARPRPAAPSPAEPTQPRSRVRRTATPRRTTTIDRSIVTGPNRTGGSTRRTGARTGSVTRCHPPRLPDATGPDGPDPPAYGVPGQSAVGQGTDPAGRGFVVYWERRACQGLTAQRRPPGAVRGPVAAGRRQVVFQKGQRWWKRGARRASSPATRPAGMVASRASGRRSSAGYCQR